MNPMERVTTCNGATCGAPIQWQITAAGKRTPVNLDGSPHWATCPDVARFKGKPRRAWQGIGDVFAEAVIALGPPLDGEPTRLVLNIPPAHGKTNDDFARHFFETQPSPKDGTMLINDVTKANENLDKLNARKKTEAEAFHAPKSEASEVIAPVSIAKDDDEKGAPNVMATASKIVKMVERHTDNAERRRVLLAVGAGLGIDIGHGPTP